jgi:large exoprotein involved in heme utilization and adhesion
VSKGNAGSVSVAGANLSIINGGTISSDALGLGNAGDVSVSAGALRLTNFGGISSDTVGRGNGGSVMVTAGTLSIGPDGQITTDTLGAGRGGSIAVNVTGALTIDGASAMGPTTGITALTFQDSAGSAGNITVTAGSLSITPNGQITTDTFGTGKGGNIAVTVAGALSIDGTASTVPTGITALTGSSGNAGDITVAAGSLNIVTNGLISVDTISLDPSVRTGNAGSVTVNVAGALSIDGTASTIPTGITSQSGFSPGNRERFGSPPAR